MLGAGQVVSGAENQPQSQIKITPLTRQLSAEPGEVYTGDANGPFVLKVVNSGSSEATIDVAAKPYSVANKAYDSYSYSKETSYTQIAKWISFAQTEYKVPPGKTIEVPFRITVPEDAPAGGQYALVSASTKASPKQVNGQTIDVIEEAGMIVYAHVSGETREEAKVQSMSIGNLQPPKYNSDGQNERPVSTVTTVKNSGNIDFSVETSMVVSGVFSGKEIANIKEQSSTVLPDTEREITTKWADSPSFGIFKVVSTTKVLGKSYQVSQIVVVISPTLAIVALIVLVLLAVGVVVLVKLRKGGKKSGHGGRARVGKVKLEPKKDI
jgi:hypothetical protein